MNNIVMLLFIILSRDLVNCFPCESPFKCLSFLNKNTCSEGQILEYNPEKNCCPVCRGGLGKYMNSL